MNTGLYCSGGKDWFSIGSEGRVYSCNALMYNKLGYIGNIINENIVIRKYDWVRCPFQACNQICDRHWSKKQIYDEYGNVIDSQNIVNPRAYGKIKNPVSILFAPTWKCNYSCKYCGLPKKEHFPSIPNACEVVSVDKWIRAFTNFFKTNGIEGGIWHTNGGEPLYYDGIDKLFKFFYESGFKIGLTTNTSADVYEKIINVVPPDAFGVINCSVHPLDKNFKSELFKSRVQLLKSLGYSVSVNFVGHPDQLLLATEYAEWCQKLGIEFSLIPMLGKIGNLEFKTIEDYPENLRSIIKQHSRVDLTDVNKFREGKRVE